MKWKVAVNKTATATLTPFLSSTTSQYQFVHEGYKDLAMDPVIDVFVKEVYLGSGRAEPKWDKATHAAKSYQASLAVLRVQEFLSELVDLSAEFAADPLKVNELKWLSVLIRKVVDDLAEANGRLHGYHLRKVRQEVLEKSPFDSATKDKLVSATGLPAYRMFANRVPSMGGFVSDAVQSEKARRMVEGLRKKKAYTSERRNYDNEYSRYSSNQNKRSRQDSGRQEQRGRDSGFSKRQEGSKKSDDRRNGSGHGRNSFRGRGGGQSGRGAKSGTSGSKQ